MVPLLYVLLFQNCHLRLFLSLNAHHRTLSAASITIVAAHRSCNNAPRLLDQHPTMICQSSPAVVTFLPSETKLFPSPLRLHTVSFASTAPHHYCLKLLILQGRRGFTRQPKNSQRAHLSAPTLQTTTKIPRKDPQERE